MTKNNNTPSIDEQWLSAKTINYLKSDKLFVYPGAVEDAISTIVIAVHDSYKCTDNSIKYLIETI